MLFYYAEIRQIWIRAGQGTAACFYNSKNISPFLMVKSGSKLSVYSIISQIRKPAQAGLEWLSAHEAGLVYSYQLLMLAASGQASPLGTITMGFRHN